MRKLSIKQWDELEDRVPAYALVAGVDLVIVRADEKVHVFYGRCHHRGALLADGRIEGPNLICGLSSSDRDTRTLEHKTLLNRNSKSN